MNPFRHYLKLGAVLGSCLIASCGGSPAKSPEKEGGRGNRNQVPTVTVAPVQLHEFVDALEAVGTARAIDSVVISADVTERIKRLNFSDGQYVRRGQLLVELSAAEEKADLAGARARLLQAETQLERQRALKKDGWTTQSGLDVAVAARDSARAQVENIKALIGDRSIRAPFSGVVGFRDVSAGLVAGTSTPILELSDISTIRLDFSIPETALGSVTVGQEIIAQSAAFGGERFSGRIAAIDPQIDPSTRAAKVRANLPNPAGRLKPGMLLGVQIVRSKRTALAVPEQAVIGRLEERSVFVLDSTGESVSQTRVTTGTREPGLLEITGGLSPGARIVVDGALKVRDGGKIKVFGQSPNEQAAK